jgi:hypothetical protein
MRKLQVGLMLGVIAGAFLLSLQMRPAASSELKLDNIVTTSKWHSLVPERFIGCPDLMHATEMVRPFSHETLQSSSFEFLRIEIERDSLQRDHIAPGPIEHRPCPVFWPFCGEQMSG